MSEDLPVPIFLLSLPRTGSTLCQRILSASPDIDTVNEPHFLLPLLYSIKDTGVRSTYQHKYSAWAIQDFCKTLPRGEQDYLDEIGQLALRLYQKAMHKPAHYFIDKTPKYHFILKELFTIFPDGKFIFLWRNPLAILASLISTWGDGNWNLYNFYVDLFQGWETLATAFREYADRSISIRYEDVVLRPEDTFANIFEYLQIPFNSMVLQSFSNVILQGRVSDPNSQMDEYQSIIIRPLEKWRKILDNPLRKAWARRYLRWLGNERLALAGYSLEELLSSLDQIPNRNHHLLRDACWIPLGAAYHLFEFQMFKEKYQALHRGQRIYMNN